MAGKLSNKTEDIEESLVQAEIVYDELWKEIEHFASNQPLEESENEIADWKFNSAQQRWKLRKFPVFDDTLWDSCCNQCNHQPGHSNTSSICSKNTKSTNSSATVKCGSLKKQNSLKSNSNLKTCGSQRVVAVRFADRHVKKNKSDSDLRIHRVNQTDNKGDISGGGQKASPTGTFASFAMKAGGKAKEAVDRLTDLLTSFGSSDSKKYSSGR